MNIINISILVFLVIMTMLAVAFCFSFVGLGVVKISILASIIMTLIVCITWLASINGASVNDQKFETKSFKISQHRVNK